MTTDPLDAARAASRWIQFLRGYGPVPRNEAMFDEFIRRTASRLGVEPIQFSHPAHEAVVEAVTASNPVSVVLTGTAGDGKTHLCRQVWESVGGDTDRWQGRDPHVAAEFVLGGESRRLHVVRDLSAWAPQRGAPWPEEREAVMQAFCEVLTSRSASRDLFLIAANDGQLLESLHRLQPTPAVRETHALLERLLVEDGGSAPGVPLGFYNLSQHSSADLLTRALDALLWHPAWDTCYALDAPSGAFFGPDCPVRQNLERLRDPLIRRRLRQLMELCDYNRFHVPIRQILLLLSNALLGHPDAPGRLMTAEDVPGIIRAETAARASVYENLFGGNLGEIARENRLVFDALSRFGIGFETSNRVDNILIFGDEDEVLRPYFEQYLASDPYYGADAGYRAAQRDYIEGGEEDADRAGEFLRRLVGQRRALFFKIPDAQAEDLRLWDLTVFASAGEYLDGVVAVLRSGGRVSRPVLARMVRGLNRIFTGMLASSDRELFLATDLTSSAARVSRLLAERVSVDPRLGQRVDLVWTGDIPAFEVSLAAGVRERLVLTLTRFEFLSRVAGGALPSSFSKECYEDLLAFKSRLLSAAERVRQGEPARDLAFQLLSIGEGGDLSIMDLEVRDA